MQFPERLIVQSIEQLRNHNAFAFTHNTLFSARENGVCFLFRRVFHALLWQHLGTSAYCIATEKTFTFICCTIWPQWWSPWWKLAALVFAGSIPKQGGCLNFPVNSVFSWPTCGHGWMACELPRRCARLRALVYDIPFPPTAAIIDCAIGLEKLSANEQCHNWLRHKSRKTVS